MGHEAQMGKNRERLAYATEGVQPPQGISSAEVIT